MSGDPYDGWEGFCHPDAPAGGGGPGFFRNAHPAGMDTNQASDPPHPDSPAARTVLVAAAGQQDAKLSLILETFTAGVGDYAASELNDALFTLFGELSEWLHDALFAEAKAIASSILNRHGLIGERRKALQAARQERDRVKISRDGAAKRLDELSRNPSKYMKEMGAETYRHDLAVATAAHNEAGKALREAEGKLQEASNAKIAAESWVNKDRRSDSRVTLTDVVSAYNDRGEAQYGGYRTGRSLYEKYPSVSRPDRERNHQRWSTAKSALELVARDSSKRDKYLEFRSNDRGKKPVHDGRDRIGGNDFIK